MTVKPSGIGAEPKKIAILAALLAVAAYFYFSSGGSPESAASVRPGAASLPIAGSRIPTREISRTSRASGRSGRGFRAVEEFRPSLKPSKYADIDRNSVDPTLHLDLLAKLKSVKADNGTRSIFDFGQGGPAPLTAGIKEPAPILPKWRFIGPKPPLPKLDSAKAVPPPAPPIPLKFYGFVNQTKAGVRRAFFLDGDDIIVASEGQLVKNRYKIVRIGINSAVVEDTQFENRQQTLPLVEEITG